MRPTTGRRVTPENVTELWDAIQKGEYIAQRKLNGDRALMCVNGEVKVANRYGKWLGHPVINKDLFAQLPAETLLDGEVWERKFMPFEALVVGGASYMHDGPEKREEVAIELCELLHVDWIFGGITLEWISKLEQNCPMWEGVVLKQRGSPYLPLGSAAHESGSWLKRKWC
jgi:ATP-dependent DNA ligase